MPRVRENNEDGKVILAPKENAADYTYEKGRIDAELYRINLSRRLDAERKRSVRQGGREVKLMVK